MAARGSVTTEPDGTPVLQAAGDGALRTAVADAIVQLYKRRRGAGPTRVRANWVGPDAITVLLEDTLTLQERTLAEAGHAREVQETRALLHLAITGEARAVVEAITGRRVRACVSGLDPDDGFATETFVFHAEDGDGGPQHAA
jgi:uncharacterized protein YbcI